MTPLPRLPSRLAAIAGALAVLIAVGLTAVSPAAAVVTPPFDLLPAGPVPTTIPYAIGTRIFYQDRIFVVPTPGTSDAELTRVQPYHGNVLTSVFYPGTADFVGPTGVIGPTSPWRSLGGVDLSADATLTGQLLAVPAYGREVRTIDTSTNRVVARLPIADAFAHAATAGPKVLVTNFGFSNTTSQVLWDPATGNTIALGTSDAGPTYSVAQRRSPGWLWRDVGGGCFARVPVSDPLAGGTRICHDAGQSGPPLLSFDGATAIAVRDGRLVAVAMASGQALSTGTLAAIVRATDNTRWVYPVQWETASTFITEATWDGQLALVRCRLRDGWCERVVRSYVRGNVGGIVAGW